MNPWHDCQLGEVCQVVMGQAPSGESYNDNRQGHPLIAGAGDFNGVVPAPKRFTTEATKLTETGDIILAIRATIGEKVWSNGTYCLGRGVAALRPKSTLDRSFLWHWLETVQDELNQRARGATFKQVTKDDVATLVIRLPPLPEQRRIAAILDKADELRAKRLAALEQLNGLTQAIFEGMFGSVTTPTPFRTVCLGDVLRFVTSGSRGWAEFYSPTGSRFIRSLDVQMNRISDEDAVYVRAPDTAEAHRTVVEGGDVLLTITGSRIGRVASVPNALAGAYISQHVAIVRPLPTKVVPEFLSFFLSLNEGGQRQIARMQYGQTKPGLNFEQIRRFRIPLPTLALQNEFVRRLAVLEEGKSKQHESLVGFNALLASLQHRAFAGAL